MAILPMIMGSGGAQYTETSLWTNSAPTSTYTTGTLSLSDNISNYDYIKIVYRRTTSGTTEYSVVISSSEIVNCKLSDGKMSLALGVNSSGTTFYYRPIWYESDTQLSVSHCRAWGSSSNTDGNAIPYKIIGCKFA